MPQGKRTNEHEIAFGKELSRALRERGWSQAMLADAIGARRNALSLYIAGKVMPMPSRVVLMAEALTWPRLIEISKRNSLRTCILCGVEYHDAGQQRKSFYCGAQCRQTHYSRKTRERSAVNEQAARRKVRRLSEAIAAFCDDCTAGEAICRDEECSLREVSPLPFIPLMGRNRGAA